MIRSLLHVGMTVPDLKVGRSFYELFGLQPRAAGNELVFRCEGRAQDQLRLFEGPRKKLSYVSLGTNDEGMKALKARLDRAGVAGGRAGTLAGHCLRRDQRAGRLPPHRHTRLRHQLTREAGAAAPARAPHQVHAGRESLGGLLHAVAGHEGLRPRATSWPSFAAAPVATTTFSRSPRAATPGRTT